RQLAPRRLCSSPTRRSSDLMTPEDYRAALMERAAAQMRHAALAPLADAVITLSCPGPAPLWDGDKPGEPLVPRPTGDFVFNAPRSEEHTSELQSRENLVCRL